MDSTILELADHNRREALSILETLQIEAIWRSVGATPHLVGSLRSGLYSPAPLHIGDSFAALSRIARNSGIRKIEYANLLDAEDNCLEWHVQYAAQDGRLWQIDMIHLPEGSPWEGYFERVADRIAAVLTPETREAILRLKYETPDEEKIPGIAYYRAVLADGVRSYAEFAAWLREHPVEGIIEWMP